ncbi:MAG: DHA2 family efflux MFS transporter permease subunit [Actinomycetota bacterium]|nr:DHA2 family efflux MFS transporter permease subunit [Actinomycetota bacterium]
MSQTAAIEPDYPEALDSAVLKVAGVVVLGAIMSILDITVVSVALPTFAEVFNTTLATVAWTMTAYTLALATVIPATGWAADRFGTKRTYIVGLILFTFGSLLCATANSIEMLIAFRVIQGLGGGILLPRGQTILTQAAGPERLGRLMAVMGIPMLLGPIAGPILGGWLIEIASWHWIFLINVPLGIITVILALRVFPKDNPQPSEKFDFVGMLLLSPGLALFLFGISSIAETGTASFGPRVWVPATIGLILIVSFVFYSFKPKHPLIDLRLFKNRILTISSIALVMFIIAFMGAGLLFPSYFLQVRGETTLAAGLLLAPQGIGAMITMPLSGILADKFPIGRIVPFGLALIAIGMGVFTQVTNDTSYLVLCSALFVMGLGMGLSMMPLMTSALKTLTHHETARGSTLLNIQQQVGGSIGTAVMSVILTTLLAASVIVPGVVNPGTGEPMTESQVSIVAAMNPEALAGQDIPPAVTESGSEFTADAFGSTFMVAFILVLLTFIPVAFLPRRRTPEDAIGDEDAERVPIILH